MSLVDCVSVEYKLGRIEIDSARMLWRKEDHSVPLGEKFLVISHDGGRTLELYVRSSQDHEELYHWIMAVTAGLRSNEADLIQPLTFGGGILYIRDDELNMKGFSGRYGAIPKGIAEEFLWLVEPEVRKAGLDFSRAVAEPHGQLNPFWIRSGYVH